MKATATSGTPASDGDTVHIRQWYDAGGGLMINTEALDIDHPEHVYNQIESQGKRPEDYGVFHPFIEEFKDMDRKDLMREVIFLRKENMALHRAAAGLF